MIRVIPLKETDGNRLYREFFAPEFVRQRLGTPGYWQGTAAQKLGLTDQVRLGDFQSLLHGRAANGEALIRRQPVEPDRLAAWRITLTEAGPASVALWALAPGPYGARVRTAHNQAVHAAITEFERELNNRPWFDNPDAPGRKSVVFAEFQAGATRQQAPRLHTNLFLFNLLFQKGVETRSFTAEEVTRQCSRLEAAYTKRFTQELTHMLGARVQLPAELCVRLEAHPPASSDRAGERVHTPRLEGHQLLAAWRQQARASGWGPERVGAAIAEARSRPTWANWNQDSRKLLRAYGLWLRGPEHSAQRVMSAMVRGHEAQRSQSAQQPARPSTQQQSQSPSMSH
jgi:hypothetical protein